jgi:hypothetical protein
LASLEEHLRRGTLIAECPGHVQSECLDLSRLRARRVYDKGGGRNLIRDFRRYYFPDHNLTKRRCDEFFDDDDNFVAVPG